MALLFQSIWADDKPDAWRREITARLPGLEVRVWPDVGPVEDIDYALVWHPPAGELRRFPNLKFIMSLGAGVEHLLVDPDLPQVPILRLVDKELTARMTEFVVMQVLRLHRQLPAYARQQRARLWQPLTQVGSDQRRVGMMGIGELGQAAARALVGFGFDVAGWSRTAKAIDGVFSFAGDDGLKPFLARTDILVCLLPLTAATRGVLNADALGALPDGASLINVGRGALLVEKDLIPALENGPLAEAALDVFAEEPLPAEHPFWSHSRIAITPHVASLTDPRSAADEVVNAVRRAEAGEPLPHLVELDRGY